MSTAVIWSKSKPDVEFQYGERLGEFHGMASQSQLPHCRVLPPATLHGSATWRIQCHDPRAVSPGEFNGMSSQSHVSHCRVLPLGEFTVMIPEPHATLQGAVTWRNQCHDRATLQGVIIPSAAFVSSPIHLFVIRMLYKDSLTFIIIHFTSCIL